MAAQLIIWRNSISRYLLDESNIQVTWITETSGASLIWINGHCLLT